MDSGIDLNPPPWVFFSRKTIPSFGKGKVLGVALALCWPAQELAPFFFKIRQPIFKFATSLLLGLASR